MKITAYILGGIMLLGAVAHVAAPEIYTAFIPSFLSETLANILAIIAETTVGALLLMPKYRKWGGLAFSILMVIFMPIHLVDAVQDNPAIGSKTAAYIRIGFQFVLIHLGWKVYKSND